MYDVMGFVEYRKYVVDLTSKSHEKCGYGKRILIPARRFLLPPPASSQAPRAIPLAGYTIMTPSKREDTDKVNDPAYAVLGKMKARLGAVAGIVFAPPDEWHMTLADLVSQDTYAGLHGDGKVINLIGGVETLFGELQKRLNLFPPCVLKIKGIGLFPDCIVAALAPDTEEGYRVLREFRHFVYAESSVLRDLLTAKPSRFCFHITLAYIETYLTKEARGCLTDALEQINGDQTLLDVSFTVHTAQLTHFEDMTCFNSQDLGKRLPFFRF
jgi:hypothetical protein